MRNRTFHQATIGSLTFRGILSADGPYVSCQTGGGVALGVSGIRQFQLDKEGTRHDPRFGWWVVKYRDEAGIFLSDFDQISACKMSDEFGLLLLEIYTFYEQADRVRLGHFFTSPAWDALSA